jgi:hypothetical protein
MNVMNGLKFGAIYKINQVTVDGKVQSNPHTYLKPIRTILEGQFDQFNPALRDKFANFRKEFGLEANDPAPPIETSWYLCMEPYTSPDVERSSSIHPYIYTEEDALLMRLFNKVSEGFGAMSEPFSASIFDDPRIADEVEALQSGYGLDASEFFAQKGLRTVDDFRRADTSLRTFQIDPFEHPTNVVQADPNKPNLIDLAFETSPGEKAMTCTRLDIKESS